MGVFCREGTWRFQTAITWRDANGVKHNARPSGTPSEEGLPNTQQAAKDLERDKISKLKNPELWAAAKQRESESVRAAKPGRFPLLRDFAKTFLAEYEPTAANTTAITRRNILNNKIVPYFGEVPLDQINQAIVNAFIRTELKGKSASTINNTLTILSTLLTYAAAPGVVPGFVKPALTMRVSQKASAVAAVDIRAITRSEVAELLRAVRGDQRFVAIILLACDAGLRIGEIRGLMWSDVDMRGEGSIHVRRSIDPHNEEGPPKNGKARLVPGLTQALRDALKALPKRGMWIVTPLPREHDAKLSTRYLGYKGMLSKIKRAYRAVGIEIAKGGDVHPFHSLRHTFGTELAARNVPVTVIMELMGHADITTTERYITTSADQMRAAMRTLRDLS